MDANKAPVTPDSVVQLIVEAVEEFTRTATAEYVEELLAAVRHAEARQPRAEGRAWVIRRADCAGSGEQSVIAWAHSYTSAAQKFWPIRPQGIEAHPLELGLVTNCVHAGSPVQVVASSYEAGSKRGPGEGTHLSVGPMSFGSGGSNFSGANAIIQKNMEELSLGAATVDLVLAA